MKKEPLSIITVKTLLAVIIFTGVGTIIVGGAWLAKEMGKGVPMPNELRCDDLSKEIGEKMGKLDKSCQSDKDCKTVELLRLIQAGGTYPLCVNKKEAVEDVRSLQDLYYKRCKIFLPNIQIKPALFYGCECRNNVCVGINKKVQEVTVTTDKTEYEQGEMIKITVKNDLDKYIFFISPPFRNDSTLKFKGLYGNEWEDIDLYPKYRFPSVITVLGPKKEEKISIKISEIKERYIKEKNMNKNLLEFKKYKVGFIYDSGVLGYYDVSHSVNPTEMKKLLKNGKTIYSNEFTIKEKSALDLRCGEKVIGADCNAPAAVDVLCQGFSVGYEFDSGIKKCIEKVVDCSCRSFKTPFKSLEECQKVCEKQELIINSEEAIAYAKTDPDVEEFIKGWSDQEFYENTWAVFDSNKNIWEIGISPRGDESTKWDTLFLIHINPDGSIIDKGVVPAA